MNSDAVDNCTHNHAANTLLSKLPLVTMVRLAHHRAHDVAQMSANAEPMPLPARPVTDSVSGAAVRKSAILWREKEETPGNQMMWWENRGGQAYFARIEDPSDMSTSIMLAGDGAIFGGFKKKSLEIMPRQADRSVQRAAGGNKRPSAISWSSSMSMRSFIKTNVTHKTANHAGGGRRGSRRLHDSIRPAPAPMALETGDTKREKRGARRCCPEWQ